MKKRYIVLLNIFLVVLIVLFLLTNSVFSNIYEIIIYNSQPIATPSPFQQDIAICNGTVNIGNNLAYVNNTELFNRINPTGSNVFFFYNLNNPFGSFYYSWYEGQLNINGTYCDIWWIKLPEGIPANSNIKIYLYLGSYNDNFYIKYYPYTGTSPQVIQGYDNGKNVFIVYGYFNNTLDGWIATPYTGQYNYTITSNGIFTNN
ncbi:MAG: hypothetical protein ACP5GJ_04520, partial [Nanopusillaceae archaeon]